MWAIFGIRAGTNISLTAQSMGHAVAAHERTRLHWITEQEMLETMLKEVA